VTKREDLPPPKRDSGDGCSALNLRIEQKVQANVDAPGAADRSEVASREKKKDDLVK